MPSLQDYKKAEKKLKEDRTKALAELDSLNKKIERLKKKVDELKTGCKHEYEIVFLKDPDKMEKFYSLQDINKDFPGIEQKIKVDNENFILIYKNGKFDEINQFMNYFFIGLKCKTCGFIKVFDIDFNDNETSLAFKMKG